MTTPLGLYVHIPFCRQRCDFCAFYLELHRDNSAASFVQALRTEIRLHTSQDGIADRLFQSVYFGGGTPTALNVTQLVEAINDLRQVVKLTPDCEITVEAHPRTVTQPYLTALCDVGVTRISFGAESMQDEDLAYIGRPGAVYETVTAVQAARKAGCANVSLDLMYGLPHQSVESWKQSLARCIDLAPEHLSCYALTVEEGTRFAHDIRQGRAKAPDEMVQVAMSQTAHWLLSEAGYEQYEISNYAKPGYACRHNLLYWTNGDYLGLGPSAQSFVQGVRFGKIANLAEYQAALTRGQLPIVEKQRLTEEERLRDAVVFGLRLTQGIPSQLLRDHAARYGYEAELERLRIGKLIEETDDRSRLSTQGRLQADTVAEKLY